MRFLNKILEIGKYAFLFFFLALISSPLVCHYLSDAVPQTRDAISIDGNIMSINGNITKGLFEEISNSLDKNKISEVKISSNGGDSAFIDPIRNLFIEHNINLINIPSGNTCQSACVGLLVPYQGIGVTVDNKSTLLFHGKLIRFGGESKCNFCMNLDKVATFILVQGTPIMQKFANEMMPELGDKMASCKPNPFKEFGISLLISGEYFNYIRKEGVSKFSCSKVQKIKS